MSRIALAFRAFFAALFDSSKSAAMNAALTGVALPKIDTVEKPQRETQHPSSIAASRNEAVTLLAALQREARLVDLVKQPLANFSDDQIGSAARAVLGDCQKVLDRFFALQPLATGPEGSPCDVPAGYDPSRYKLSGRVEGAGPFHGQLMHHGWKATVIKLPEWTGSKDSALVISPVEVEIS